MVGKKICKASWVVSFSNSNRHTEKTNTSFLKSKSHAPRRSWVLVKKSSVKQDSLHWATLKDPRTFTVMQSTENRPVINTKLNLLIHSIIFFHNPSGTAVHHFGPLKYLSCGFPCNLYRNSWAPILLTLVIILRFLYSYTMKLTFLAFCVISWQLLDGLPWHFVQISMVPINSNDFFSCANGRSEVLLPAQTFHIKFSLPAAQRS